MDANVSDIACSSHGTFIIKTDGSLWAIGHNRQYRMGHNDGGNHATPQMVFASGVQAVSGGHEHSLFLKTDGSLWSSGYGINWESGSSYIRYKYSIDQNCRFRSGGNVCRLLSLNLLDDQW